MAAHYTVYAAYDKSAEWSQRAEFPDLMIHPQLFRLVSTTTTNHSTS